MRTSFFLTIAIGLSTVMILNSCDPAPITPPLVTVNPSADVTAAPGATLVYEWLINSDTDLKTAGFKANHNATLLTSADSIFPAGVQAAIINVSFKVPETMVDGAAITLTFTASNTEQTVVTRTVNVVIPPGEINTYTAVIMADLENPEGKSFYSVEDNKLMNINAAITASAEIDLIYYYGATNKASLCAPADKAVEAFKDSKNEIIVQKFATRNNTKLAALTMTVQEFASVANDVIIKAKTPTATNTAVTMLVKDNILWCETVTGKKALIKVVDITGGQSTSLITIEVKVQK